MKRFTLSMVITAVLGLAAYTLSGAQAPGRGPGLEGPGGRGSGGPGFGRGLVGALRGIELTEEQRQQIRAIHDAERASRPEPAEAQLHRDLQAALYADTPDQEKIAALQQQLLASQSARLAKEIAVEQKIAQVLTAEQRATVRERLSQPRSPRGPRSERRELTRR